MTEKGPTTSGSASHEPPAYTSPIVPAQEQQAAAAVAAADTTTAAPPPPQYKPKRTPSQEAIYIRELQAWATEKEKMYEGAYGEYFGKIVDPDRVPRWRWDEWHRMGGDRMGPPGSQLERDEQTDKELRELKQPLHSIPPKDPMRKDSAGEGSSAPKEGFVKRRMSHFINKMKKHQAEPDPEDVEDSLRARDELVAEERARQPKHDGKVDRVMHKLGLHDSSAEVTDHEKANHTVSSSDDMDMEKKYPDEKKPETTAQDEE